MAGCHCRPYLLADVTMPTNNPNPIPAAIHMRFFPFIFGMLLLIGGLAWGAIELGVPQLWVAIGSLILLGFGIIVGLGRARVDRSAGGVTVVHDDKP